MTRDAILRKWVRQPRTSPLIRHPRDEERRRALSHLDGSRVLDLASESRVTAGIDAESVTRVDFSPDASAYAREVLGDDIEYVTTDPEAPALPFEGNEFDAAVSIGPYDWRFLDVSALTAELHRVLASEGRFVFSALTPRSPYAVGGWPTGRYFTPREALALVAPDWHVVTVESCFQYPYYAHMAINTLPERYQTPFVAVAERASDELTRRDLRRYASLLVLSAEPLDYSGYLDAGLDCLFRPVEKDGFWDPNEKKFLRALEYDLTGDGDEPTDFEWTPDDGVFWRYAPFALMGAMHWRRSDVGDTRYDDELRDVLSYFTERIEDALSEMPSYAIGPLSCAFSLADDVFDGSHLDVARDLFEFSRGEFDFSRVEDCLLAYGWSYLAERIDDEAVLAALSAALWRMNDRLSPTGAFVFEDHTTRRHQNQMYACWGFARAVAVTGQTGYLENLERSLDRTIEKRMRADGAFVWEDVSLARRARRAATKKLGFRPPHWDFLYECHQTFFVNAVAEYVAAGGERDYEREVARAMAWIYGESSAGNLVEASGLGVPLRYLTVDGRLDVPDQMYKGSYEVGSYLMALTNLLAGPLASGSTTSDS